MADLTGGPIIAGILNVTPDSFSDGGLYLDQDAAIARGLKMISDGARIIDIGGESTRPGAEPVDASVETRRVLPVIAGLHGKGAALSIDTTKSDVARAAIAAGAEIVNDVSSLKSDPRMVKVVAEHGATVVLMHMKGTPRTMQANPTYSDVVTEVRDELLRSAEAAQAEGVKESSIVLDPGIGFGKTLAHNLALLKNLGSLTACGYPVMVGVSRKSFIGKILDTQIDDRLEGTAAAVAWCVAQGVAILRVHDVKEMVRVTKMVEAIKGA